MVQEEIGSGHFHSVDELIVEGVYAWREKHQIEQRQAPAKPPKNLVQVLLDSPFAGYDLDLERDRRDRP